MTEGVPGSEEVRGDGREDDAEVIIAPTRKKEGRAGISEEENDVSILVVQMMRRVV